MTDETPAQRIAREAEEWAAAGYRKEGQFFAPTTRVVCLVCGAVVGDSGIHSAHCSPGDRDRR